MQRKQGSYIIQSVVGESYKAYVPAKLPPLDGLYPMLERATQAVAELNSLHQAIPNTALFLYMLVLDILPLLQERDSYCA